MCIRAVNTCSFVFNSVSDRNKTQEMCDKAVDDNPNALDLVPGRLRLKKCVIKLLMIILLHWNLPWIDIRKGVTKLFPKIPLC